MAKRNIRNRSNYVPDKGRKYTEKSITIQNDQVSLGKLLANHAHGMAMIGRTGVFTDTNDHDEPDAQQFRNLDPVDREYVLDGIKEMTQRLRALEAEMRAEAEKKASAKAHTSTPIEGV